MGEISLTAHVLRQRDAALPLLLHLPKDVELRQIDLPRQRSLFDLARLLDLGRAFSPQRRFFFPVYHFDEVEQKVP